MSSDTLGWVIPVLNLLILSYLLVRSRTWTEPVRALRLETAEQDIKVLRGNLHRLERDLNDWHREMLDVNEQILKEVQAIQRNGAREHPLEEKVDQIVERVEDLEQAIHGLPCGQSLPEACPAKEK